MSDPHLMLARVKILTWIKLTIPSLGLIKSSINLFTMRVKMVKPKTKTIDKRLETKTTGTGTKGVVPMVIELYTTNLAYQMMMLIPTNNHR